MASKKNNKNKKNTKKNNKKPALTQEQQFDKLLDKADAATFDLVDFVEQMVYEEEMGEILQHAFEFAMNDTMYSSERLRELVSTYFFSQSETDEHLTGARE